MAITQINVGAVPDDGTGDPLRVGFQKTNQNVSELVAQIATKADDAATTAALAGKANIASPNLTGNPTAPTPAATDNSTRLQTTGGSLLQTRQFGIGAVAGSSYTPSLLTHTTGGLFTADPAVSAAGGLPLGTLQHSIQYIPGVSAATGAMEATALTGNATNSGRKWFNKRNGGTLLGWQEFAFLTSTFPNLKIGNVASADANTLDYYEEGVWTPTLAGATTAGTFTYSVQSGSFTRVGDLCTATCDITVSANSVAPVGNLRINGLPFVTNNRVVAARQSGCIGYYNGLQAAANITGLAVSSPSAVSRVDLFKVTAGGSAAVELAPGDISLSTFRIHLTLTYKVNP